jgi:hypothetical protein
MKWNVIEVKAISPLSIHVIFSDGTSGKVQFKPSHLTGVFEPLKDPEIFRQAFIENGAVTWPGNVDLAPDAMYQAIKTNGEWILN